MELRAAPEPVASTAALSQRETADARVLLAEEHPICTSMHEAAHDKAAASGA
jgi:hypothetical protein